MGFLKKFIKNTFRDGQPPRGRSSFENLSEEQLETHLKIANYDGFSLTDAVRPSYDLQIIPRAGYRHDKYHDDRTGVDIPVLMVSASRRKRRSLRAGSSRFSEPAFPTVRRPRAAHRCRPSWPEPRW